jgi:hypothetical protein
MIQQIESIQTADNDRCATKNCRHTATVTRKGRRLCGRCARIGWLDNQYINRLNRKLEIPLLARGIKPVAETAGVVEILEDVTPEMAVMDV